MRLSEWQTKTILPMGKDMGMLETYCNGKKKVGFLELLFATGMSPTDLEKCIAEAINDGMLVKEDEENFFVAKKEDRVTLKEKYVEKATRALDGLTDEEIKFLKNATDGRNRVGVIEYFNENADKFKKYEYEFLCARIIKEKDGFYELGFSLDEYMTFWHVLSEYPKKKPEKRPEIVVKEKEHKGYKKVVGTPVSNEYEGIVSTTYQQLKTFFMEKDDIDMTATMTDGGFIFVLPDKIKGFFSISGTIFPDGSMSVKDDSDTGQLIGNNFDGEIMEAERALLDKYDVRKEWEDDDYHYVKETDAMGYDSVFDFYLCICELKKLVRGE